MDVYTDRTISRLEIVETGGRRRFSAAAKLRIVAESYSGRRLGSATARKYGITRSQLADWRNAARAGRFGAVSPDGFVPVVAEASSPVAGSPLSSCAGRMEIVSQNGRRVIVDNGVDVSVLLCVVRGLETL
ncbi:MAG TPA: transposase [Nitrobacter sp.]|nr:transposase [Nitrobacter sp.]